MSMLIIGEMLLTLPHIANSFITRLNKSNNYNLIYHLLSTLKNLINKVSQRFICKIFVD